MQQIQTIKKLLQENAYEDRLRDLYIDETQIPYQTSRYIQALNAYASVFGEDEAEIFSAPGRTEIGGNHTDHQHGCVLAAAVNLDAIAVVKPLTEPVVRIKSGSYDLITVSLTGLEPLPDSESPAGSTPLPDSESPMGLEPLPEETGSTAALIKGVLAGFCRRGYSVGGFQAYITSDVLIGAGLSSSAAFETIIGTILSCLYNDNKVSPVEIAMIGQFAENTYFGKPCGLMDQTACSVGSLVYMDFLNPDDPKVRRINYDFAKQGYTLCIVDTKGSHADLTADYASIPTEMRNVSHYFGKDYLREVSEEELFARLPELRGAVGDRAVLRAIHFMEEQKRVLQEVDALQQNDFSAFLNLMQSSGHSSFEFLQNVYSPGDTGHQNLSLALAVSEALLKDNGVCRVHGGGFAGTIQAFVRDAYAADYQAAMDAVFGKGSCKMLKIRKYGGIRVL